MASDEGVQAGGSGAGRDRKRAAQSAPQPGSNGRRGAAPKTPPAGAEVAASQVTPPQATPPIAPQAAPAQADSDDLVVVTLKASTGSIVSVEMAAPDGSRHPLTDSETERLVGERPTFASLVHDAFEAGIACVLDEAAGGDERRGETEEDADLHDALLDALIEHSAAKRLLSRETLHSAVLGTIIHASRNGKPAAPPAA